jgi:hypothetical protein
MVFRTIRPSIESCSGLLTESVLIPNRVYQESCGDVGVPLLALTSDLNSLSAAAALAGLLSSLDLVATGTPFSDVLLGSSDVEQGFLISLV